MACSISFSGVLDAVGRPEVLQRMTPLLCTVSSVGASAFLPKYTPPEGHPSYKRPGGQMRVVGINGTG